MKSSFARTARQLSRNASNVRLRQCRAAGARWQSTGASSEGRQWSTPLAKQLGEAIKTTGPIPVASYMRHCLTGSLNSGGYYTQTLTDKDPFGRKGDFVTSPEISQIFGELIGVWVVAEWIAQGRKSSGVCLMEMGPGRGTLMDDMLRTIRNFPPLAKAIEAVYMVEASPGLREAQHKLLCGENNLEETALGWQSVSRHSKELKIVWCEDVRFVPKDAAQTPFIIAHEFFDALPIHVFQSAPPATPEQTPDTISTPTGTHQVSPQRRLPQASQQNQWRELLVNMKAPHRLKADEPEFELTAAKASTPHSMYLPETSPRYKALKATDGATIEVSPESQSYTANFAARIGGDNPAPQTTKASTQSSRQASPAPERISKPEPSGAALIIDYGPAATIPMNSLRGIKAHERVSPFHSPGTTDISADVDFMALAETSLNASPGVEVHGPVSQAVFLTAMGIEERAAQLVKRAVDKERGGVIGKQKGELTELVKRIESGWKRLVDRSPQGMGRLYQVMAVVPYAPNKQSEVRRRPVGFGGDVQV